MFGKHRSEETRGFNPFDPIQDTERCYCVARVGDVDCFNPFDPIQDTERHIAIGDKLVPEMFQPIRSDTGY